MSTLTVDEWPEYLSPRQLAEMLQLPSVSSIYDWNRKGTGPPYYRIGRHIRYRKDVVLKWLETRDASSGWM